MTRWTLACGALAGIVLIYRYWLHVNPTTVALTLLVYVLLLAAKWELRYAIFASLAATVCYNVYFLPPIGTLTIADPQNWISLFAFLAAAILASRLAETARAEAADARARQRELEMLLRLSREILESDSLASLLQSAPAAVASAAGARMGALYLLDGDRIYQAGPEALKASTAPLRQLAEATSEVQISVDELQIPIRIGLRPRGLLILRGATLQKESAEAMGGLISIAIERAQALESLARGQAAKENERLRTLMIDSITHELRTPLTSIKGAATALLAGEVAPDQRRELLEIIDEESDRLNRLVGEAVETAQLDAQHVQLHLDVVNLSRLVGQVLEGCGWVKEKHPVRTEIDRRLWARVDPALIEKVLWNLIGNAAKYSPDGSQIVVSAEWANDEMVAIRVADRGMGIDSAEQSLIFERYYRGSSQANRVAGTGMGLAISRAIVESHGGEISLTSQPGRGSVFTVTLPAAEGSAIAEEERGRTA